MSYGYSHSDGPNGGHEEEDTSYHTPRNAGGHQANSDAPYTSRQPYDHDFSQDRRPNLPYHAPVPNDDAYNPSTWAEHQVDTSYATPIPQTQGGVAPLSRPRPEVIQMNTMESSQSQQRTPPRRRPLPPPSQQSNDPYAIPIPPAHTHFDDSNAIPVSSTQVQAVDPTQSLRPQQGYSDRHTPSPQLAFSPYTDRTPAHSRDRLQTHSFSSNTGLVAAAADLGHTPSSLDVRNQSPYGHSGPSRSRLSYMDETYGYEHSQASRERVTLGAINPAEIEDDDDDPFPTLNKGNRHSGLGAVAAGAGTSNFFKSRDTSGAYGAVPGGSAAQPPAEQEKSNWLKKQTSGNKRMKWLVAGLILLVIVLAVTGGVVGTILSHKSSSSDAPKSLSGLENNSALHKVFPGIDYTPINSLYPACLENPPIQKNITMDIAVLAQLTPHIRLYGTDCNVTEMVLQGISDLNLGGSVKVWAGVYLDGNSTTNERQLSQLYSVLKKHGADPFAGVIVGNEVLFSNYMSEAVLIETLTSVRSNLTTMGISSLPLATSDLGSKWTTQLAEAVDVVMSNIHPFFAGIPAAEAASWTYTYWQQTDIPVTKGLSGKRQLIAETGWPSQGGNDCGTDTAGNAISCNNATAGSVAGIDEINNFLSEWVCQALTNGTEYFWFEAIDEPWKAIYNKPGQTWETNWGLMDVNRNLKNGITIPDCGGKTASL